jgi:hypothetical protein
MGAGFAKTGGRQICKVGKRRDVSLGYVFLLGY